MMNNSTIEAANSGRAARPFRNERSAHSDINGVTVPK